MQGKPNFLLPQITDGGIKPASLPSIGSAPGPPPPPGPSAAPPPPPPPPMMSNNTPPPPPPMMMNNNSPPPPPMMMNNNNAMAPPPPPMMMMGGPPPPPAAAAAAAEEEIDESSSTAAGGSGRSFLEQIKGMSVDRLRTKEESAIAAKKVQKKEEEDRPLSLQDALKSRLSRLNNAISGKTDKETQRRDSMKIREARMTLSAGESGFDYDSAKPAARSAPPPPPMGARPAPPAPAVRLLILSSSFLFCSFVSKIFSSYHSINLEKRRSARCS
jgi:hypothetical protein